MTDTHLSRRRFALSTGLGVAVVAAQPDAGWASHADLAADPLALWARLRGYPSGGPRRFSLSGEAYALDPGGRMRALARVEGGGEVSLRPLDGGWRVSHAETLRFHDLETGVALGAFTNPLTGAQTVAEPLRMRGDYTVMGAKTLTLRRAADGLVVEERHGFAPPHETASQVLTFILANPAPGAPLVVRTRIARTIAWPAWMRVPHAGAPCLILAQLT